MVSRRGFILAAIGTALCPLGIQLGGYKQRVLVVYDGETKTIREGEEWDQVIMHGGTLKFERQHRIGEFTIHDDLFQEWSMSAGGLPQARVWADAR